MIEKGKTCPRCSSTELELSKALKILKRKLSLSGITITLKKERIGIKSFSDRPSESNRIWINGRPLEQWLKADVGQSPCCSTCGDVECRTVNVGKRQYEAIPSELIVKAALLAVNDGSKRRKT